MAERLPDPLVVMALEVESQGMFERAGVPVLFTGLGKVNATFALTRRLADYRCSGQQLKFVTDGADHAAASSWQSDLPRAAAEFLRLYKTLVDAAD